VIQNVDRKPGITPAIATPLNVHGSVGLLHRSRSTLGLRQADRIVRLYHA
jgi:hypothetical protein